MKVMISQPMGEKTDKEIKQTREKAIEKLNALGCEVLNTFFEDDWCNEVAMKVRGVTNKPLCFLAASLDSMSLCDAVYFCKGWEEARGCKIEHDTAVAYGLTVIYEED